MDDELKATEELTVRTVEEKNEEDYVYRRFHVSGGSSSFTSDKAKKGQP